MSFVKIALVCVLFAGLPLQADGQLPVKSSTRARAIPHQAFSGSVENQWAIQSPGEPDIEPDFDASGRRSMSPDHWSSATSINDPPVSDEYDFQPSVLDGPWSDAFAEDSNQAETSATPSMPDLKAESSYSEVRFGVPDPVRNPDVSREPTTGFSGNPLTSGSSVSWQPRGSSQPEITSSKVSDVLRYPLESEVSIRDYPTDFNPNTTHIVEKRYVLPSDSGKVSPSSIGPSTRPGGSAFGAVEDWYGSGSPPQSPLVGPGPESARNENPVPPEPKYPDGFDLDRLYPTNPNPGQSPYRERQEDRPAVGYREPLPTVRGLGSFDSGARYGFEEKGKPSPSLRETFATGRFFASVSALYLKPAFQANTAISTMGVGGGNSTPFDFDYESAPMIRFGFESKPGPGIELNYWRYDETSNVTNFTSTGTVTGTVSTWMLGPSRWTRLSAVNAGETITAAHTVDVDSIGATFFKEVQLPISRFTGKFGFQWVNATQTMNATLSDGGGTIGQLTTRSDLRAFGPSFAFEYYRPIGHTRLEIVSTVGGSLLFGHRDQWVRNTMVGDFNRIGADEFLSTADLLMGVQYMRPVAEKRGYYARLGLTYQTWMGGGTAVDPEGDFGLRGFSFSLGYNR